MPHIFPRRFLRTRDVLDPTYFNEDFHPVYDVLQGRLDRTNFNAGNLKTNLRPHPDSATPQPTGPSVAEGAYFKTHVSQIESRVEFWHQNKAGSARTPPNFVRLDGATFRDYFDFDGANPNAYPSIVPNHGAWSAVKNANLSDSQKLTFTTGHSKIWVSAYAQYIWQGFFEYKKPWIPGLRFRGADLEAPEANDTWYEEHGTSHLAIKERMVLNRLGPSPTHESLPSLHTENKTENIEIYDEEFSYPLNENSKWTSSTSREIDEPHKHGYHHISKGFLPCLVQFAIRLDGKIIEETITGKRLPYEESPHGLKVSDGIRTKEEDEIEKEEWENVLGAGVDPESIRFVEQITGQRSWGVTSTLGESKDSRPGQKIKSSRAVSYGPEVMPTRLGAVVEVQPGEHTIELCVRRLQRKKGKFKKGDFVGVFSRRLVAFDLPIHPSRTPTDNLGSSSSSPYYFDPLERIPSFKTETEVTGKNVKDVREVLSNTINTIPDSALNDEVLTNKYLPSKVVYSETSTIVPGLTVNQFTGVFESDNDASTSEAIFPGYKHGDTLANNVVPRHTNGWRTTDGSSLLSTSRLGWLQLQKNDGFNKLSITPPASEQVLRPHEQLILMMDVELRSIQPLYSDDALNVLNMMNKYTDGVKLRKYARDYLPYCLAERYLDLFAFFAIGYKEDGSWIVSTDSAPSVVNSFNWLNRSALFDASSKMVNLPMKRLGKKNYWDMDPGWRDVGRIDEFFEDDPDDSFYIGPTTGIGGNLVQSNLGINIPIMTVIENTGTTDRVITEFGGFTCTMCPSIWTKGYSPSNPREVTVTLGIIPGESSDSSTVSTPFERQWASPVGGRDILQGVRVDFGNARLTAIKVQK